MTAWVDGTLETALKGVILGFSIAAPVGPIGVLCMRRTLDAGVLAGVAGGLGTALADAAYASIAAFGIAGLAATLQSARLPLAVVGAALLLWMGGKTFLAPSHESNAPERGQSGLLGTTAATFALTAANPATILSFAAVFAGLGLAAGVGASSAAAMVGGVFAGSMAWWVILSCGVASVRRRIGPRTMRWMNRISGAILIAFGLIAAGTLLA